MQFYYRNVSRQRTVSLGSVSAKETMSYPTKILAQTSSLRREIRSPSFEEHRAVG